MLTFSHEVRPAYQYAWKNLVNSSTQSQYTQDETAYNLTFNLPGFRAEDVKVSVEKGILEIAVVDSAIEEKGEGSELQAAESLWEKRYRLPDDVDASHIDAELKLGQLLVTLNKVPQAKPVTIEVKS